MENKKKPARRVVREWKTSKEKIPSRLTTVGSSAHEICTRTQSITILKAFAGLNGWTKDYAVSNKELHVF